MAACPFGICKLVAYVPWLITWALGATAAGNCVRAAYDSHSAWLTNVLRELLLHHGASLLAVLQHASSCPITPW
jgi:hypothetical protein